MRILAGAGVACGAVLDSAEVLANEHLRGRGTVVDLEHPDRGRFPMLGNPVRLSASPTEVRRAPSDLSRQAPGPGRTASPRRSTTRGSTISRASSARSARPTGDR
jgi:hypothetical protein